MFKLRIRLENMLVVLSHQGGQPVRFRSLGNFVYPTLPQSTQLQMSTNTVWKVPAMASVLRTTETRFKHWPYKPSWLPKA